MFEYLGTVLVDIDPGFDVLRYLTVRTIGGTVTALLLSIFLGPKLINWLQMMQFRQFGVERGPDSHKEKSGTPTMGGMLILISLFISILFWSDLSSNIVWLIFSITILFGLIGALDAYSKLKNNNPEGFKASYRLIVEFFIWLYTMFKDFYTIIYVFLKFFLQRWLLVFLSNSKEKIKQKISKN